MEESDEKTNEFIFSSVLSISILSDHYRRNSFPFFAFAFFANTHRAVGCVP
jgi:hypothetical protein